MVLWTFGNGDAQYAANTKEKARKIRKDEFGHLYASEKEMNRLIPLYKAEYRAMGFEPLVMIRKVECDMRYKDNRH